MDTDERSTGKPKVNQWRWPHEAPSSERMQDRATERLAFRTQGLPDGVADNEELRRAVIEHPEDDVPRHAYAAWMQAQEHTFSRTLGAFVTAQLRVAEAFRADPRADVTTLRRWNGEPRFVSMVDFRAGDTLRPWFLDDFSALISHGLVGWPQIYRGFVERVAMRASRFLELADELFCLAPIRHLVLIRAPEVIDQLAACPHLARIRSLSLPRHSRADELSDELLARLLASPHLGKLAHLRLVHQQGLTLRAYEHVVTAGTLPMLSHFEIFMPLSWEHEPAMFDPTGRSERMIAYDTPVRAVLPKDWIADLEHAVGYVPCVHAYEHYGRDFVDIEAVVAHPIALDADIMARHGRPVAGPSIQKVRWP